MAKFLIELDHEPTPESCANAIKVLHMTKSHFFSQADWGCNDGVHKAWIILDVDDKNEARGVVPTVFRSKAKIVQLNTFTMNDADTILRQHAS